MDRPIPAFYACYLLRSTVRHQNLYVGSTPHPVRRLKQHNGIAKGGAVRTSKNTLRPWEMTCLVTGFPSKIAALQFEWAWQNTHQTRHIAPDERITQANTKQRFSPRTGKVRKRTGRPRMSMHDKLANLHILLRAKSFERWPLQVKFFAEDVYKMWHRWTVNMPEVIRQGIEVEMDESVLQNTAPGEHLSNPVGIHKIDPTYQHMKTFLEKSRRLLVVPNNNCVICCSSLDATKEMALVCSSQECNSIFHVGCLSSHFLKGEYGAEGAIVPTHGHCPSCESSLDWTDLVKDLSLRIRGEKEVTALFKEPKHRKKNVKESAKSAAVVDEDEAEEPDVLANESDLEVDFDDVLLQSDYEDVDQMQATPSGGDDEWKLVDELNEQDTPRVVDSVSSSAAKVRKAVIEDSDWDEAEVIE